MYFSKKQQDFEEVIIENTVVFSCITDTCNGWMRKEFATDALLCPFCGNDMVEEVRELPRIK
ncbi:cold-inducible protein YdjO-related protein [Peribacillus alkalitolerans]|uniref:cold-inducible protein YdjO-related protein n=1 Tax=Peribacillus alkalitolerans TaxID=1550385 RepID=UPI0013D2728D|nr:cold-inducible protein YdjO-related protein [Peribacillus alkalitolerans]